MTGFTDALLSDGPAHTDLAMFGRFVGSWRLDWTAVDSAGTEHTAVGELHLGWILGGRAGQDIWIVAGREQPGVGQPPMGFYGTTERFFDAALGAWRSTWMDTVNGRVRRFIGRPDGPDIDLRSDEESPLLHWRFTDIAGRPELPSSFTWQARTSHDGGA